jgi:hypothetical protein
MILSLELRVGGRNVAPSATTLPSATIEVGSECHRRMMGDVCMVLGLADGNTNRR